MPNQYTQGWTDEEVTYMEDNVGNLSFDAIAKNLGRDVGAVERKLEKLGMSNTKERTGLVTMHELAQCLGIDDKVVKRLIETKGLPYARKNFRRGEHNERRGKEKKRLFYYINVESFWKWAEKNKDLLNWYKVEPYILLPEPAWLEERRREDYYKWKLRARPWTEEDDALVWQYYYTYAMTQKEIGEKMSRTTVAVEKRLKRLREAKSIVQV